MKTRLGKILLIFFAPFALFAAKILLLPLFPSWCDPQVVDDASTLVI